MKTSEIHFILFHYLPSFFFPPSNCGGIIWNGNFVLFHYFPFHFDPFYSIPSLSINLNKTLFKGKYTFIILAHFRDKNTYEEYFQRRNYDMHTDMLMRWYCHKNKKSSKNHEVVYITGIDLIHCLTHSRIRYNINHEYVLYTIAILSHHLIHEMKEI